jgi:hypothetical protein
MSIMTCNVACKEITQHGVGKVSITTRTPQREETRRHCHQNLILFISLKLIKLLNGKDGSKISC